MISLQEEVYLGDGHGAGVSTLAGSAAPSLDHGVLSWGWAAAGVEEAVAGEARNAGVLCGRAARAAAALSRLPNRAELHFPDRIRLLWAPGLLQTCSSQPSALFTLSTGPLVLSNSDLSKWSFPGRCVTPLLLLRKSRQGRGQHQVSNGQMLFLKFDDKERWDS